MFWLLAALRRGFKERIGWKRVGIAASLVIIAFAITTLVRTLKGIDTGVMQEPMLRAWMTESVKPATHHDALAGRWVAEGSLPSPTITARRLFLTDAGLQAASAPLAARILIVPPLGTA